MPALAEGTDAMSPARAALQGKTFRCFAYRRGPGVFVAECIDLNLIVKAKTMKKAVSSLGDAIEGYLEVVTSGEDQRRLIHRASPFSHRIHYHSVGVKLRLARGLNVFKNLPDQMKRFECPAFCHV